MILPEDTKEPLYSDDEDDYYLPQSLSITHAAQQAQYYPAYTSSPPYTSSSHPLLEAQEDDIELGPAPPYSTHYDPPTVVSFRPMRSEKRRSSWTAFRRAAFWVGMGIAATMFLVFWAGLVGGPRRAWRGRRPHHWDGGFEHDVEGQDGDGTPVTCVNYTASGWKQLPHDLPHRPTGPLENGASMWSVNQTFLLPTNAPGDIFAHLTGYAGVGNYMLDTYDPADDDMYKADLDGIYEKAPPKGEYVRVKVEPVVTLRADEEMEGSDGLRLLQAAKVCLMDRSPHGRAEQHDGPPGPPPMPGRGVGMYTRKIEGLPSHDHKGSPLHFRIHVAIPTTMADSPSFAQGLIDAMSGGHGPRHPKGLVQELRLSGEVGGIFVSNLTAATIRELDLRLQVGQIFVDDLRADDIRLKTKTGEIKGKVAVMRSIDADTPTGEIDLDLTIAMPQMSALPAHPPFADRNGSVDVALIPPVHVNARTASGSVKINYTGWEDEARTLSQNIHSFVGAVEVHAHPLYQGPYYISSDLGQADVDIPPTTDDPTGRGRVRDISLEKQGRLGSFVWQGEAKWRDPEGQATEAVSRDGSDKLDIDMRKRARDQPRMDIKTTVGSVRLVF